MSFILVGTGLCVGASVLITLLVRVAYLVLRKSPRRFWIRALWVHSVLVPGFALVVVPAAVGFLGARMVQTRGDEISYQGPRVDSAGDWQLQSRESLAKESRGASEPDAKTLRLARERAVHFEHSSAHVVEPGGAGGLPPVAGVSCRRCLFVGQVRTSRRPP